MLTKEQILRELKMLIINETMWEEDHILKVHSSCDWDKPDTHIITDCVLESIRQRLQNASETQKEAILIVDLSKGVFPPLGQVLKIAKNFVTMRSLIVSGLECTIIYADTEEKRQWIDRVLMVYTPAKPVHVVRSREDVRRMVGNYRNIAVEASA